MKKLLGSILFFCIIFTQFACNDCTIENQEEDIRARLESEGKLQDAIEADNGVYVYITEEGTGTELPTENSTVNVKYTGYYFDDGAQFDSSNGSTVQYNLGTSSIIEGWRVGLRHFNEGDKGTMYIPAAMAYGCFDFGGIPAGSILVFDIEMVSFF